MPLLSLAASPTRDERLVLVGLTLTVVAVVAGMLPVLRRFRDTSEIKAVEPKKQFITHETEDALQLSTLETLVGHYNYSIRETAAKIVFDRAVNDKTVLRALLWGIAQPDYDERMKHLQMLSMVADQNNLYLFNSPVAYSAFVRSLEHCLGTVEPDAMVDQFVDEYPLRDIAEKMCLMFLGNLACKFGVGGLVRARFVERWLAKQPWVAEAQVAADMDYYVASRDGNDRLRHEGWVRQQLRLRNFFRYLGHRENRITEICLRLQKSQAGLAALVRAGLQEPPQRHQRQPHHHRAGQTNGLPATRPYLWPASWGAMAPSSAPAAAMEELAVQEAEAEAEAAAAEDGDDAQREELLEADEEDEENEDEGIALPAGLDSGGGGGVGLAQQTRQPRPPSQNSQEEQRIRRQHREAMVLNDGTRPLRRGDIIERESEC